MSKRIVSGVFSLLFISLQGCGSAELESNEESVQAMAVEQQLAAGRRHCVAEAHPVKLGEPLPARVPASAVECFGTFSEALSFATKGRVRLPAAAVPADLKQEDLQGAVSASSTYVIGIEYADADFNGPSFMYTSSTPCSPGVGNGVPHLSTYGFNDMISSARAYSGCNNSRHYEHDFWQGAERNCGTECSNIGAAMNDRTSSILWTN